ncbi:MULTISPECIES: TIGR03086 family metal-binding protein [Streptomyces]|uniref:TIGR03086 family protein n=1 Tax=Streptomyces venezuelae TaxID=54571 RepID=A0A5P2BNC3_STRVZ|nr:MULTISPECIES: TIGR03086 family metal-binding protein [Streptomyces]NDZ99405.1 TIGR03086 family protein [Streptomyces sp. SID10116]MYY85858.1 TIGR03086 family protein [Streptomyces sp. SID335]MYZ16659.1 TIGR03086 family protein [Streptomyces sp. SID337]NDZ88740.1 TIGR03086 family protein [Streptomyces sp. SID10115]NEB45785.1 TIGR03086 family protein [Streptomyces sp. SID339]
MDTSRTPTAPSDLRISELLALAVERAAPVVRGLPDDCLGAPTPCADYDVRALVNHLFHVVVQFQELAAKRDADFSGTPDHLAEHGDDWRERLLEEADKLVGAWGEPGADEGTTGAMDMPAGTVGCMVLLDLTVHAWDLARATGQEYAQGDGDGDPVVVRLTGAVEGMAPMARKMGVFGEAVPVDEARTSAFERLLASTGRDPYWTPGRVRASRE